MKSTYWLTNLRLETSFQYEHEKIIATNTDLFHLLIMDGKIDKIIPATKTIEDQHPRKDGQQLLALPSFTEKHCHLDKTLLGDQWQAVAPTENIFEQFEYEKNALKNVNTSTEERAENLIEHYIKQGVTHIRTHIDLYDEVGLSNLKAIKKVFQKYEDRITYEIVAFPQHGLIKSHAEELVRQALRSGATHVGGVDPSTVDGNIELSLKTMIDLAVEENAGIDLHLHEPNYLGVLSIKRLAQLTIEANLENKVSISHAYCLGDVSSEQVCEMASLLEKAGITIISSVPINRNFPPMGELKSRGVSVAVGCDNVFDKWSPFGNGDLLEKVERLAEISNWTDEQSLAQSLGFITNGLTPLDEAGHQEWPKVGDEANLVLVEANCSAEVVARRARRRLTMFKGNITWESL